MLDPLNNVKTLGSLILTYYSIGLWHKSYMKNESNIVRSKSFPAHHRINSQGNDIKVVNQH